MMQSLIITSIVLLWIVVLFNLVLTLGIAQRLQALNSMSPNSHTLDTLRKGEPAPAFLAETMNGQQASLESYSGKSVAFHFLSAHCEPCREILPDLIQLAPLAARAGVQFVLVMLEEAQIARAFVEEFQISLPVLVAPRPGNDFAKIYKVAGTPSYCLVNGQGLVESAGHPSMGGWKQLEVAWKQQSKASEKIPVKGR